ncbi:hypothetical protein ID866_6717 [Astraeus odoratus]|nr:hypothetical protein ID866_6717 [Astraeus odoratus]
MFDLMPSLVFEWVENGNAISYVQNPAIDPRALLVGIAQGLRYLHFQEAYPIIHGDLRGKNVLISKDGQAMLSDYGFSLLYDDDNYVAPNPNTGSADMVMWTAPEIMQGTAEKNSKSDVWSYGMTALELFTRRSPFHDVRGLRTVISCIMNGTPERPSDEVTRSRMTDEWWEFCCLCWKQDPSDRPTMLNIIDRLDELGWLVPE